MDRKKLLASLGASETPDQKTLDLIPRRKDFFAGLPDLNAAPKTIEDHQVRFNETPHWDFVKRRFSSLSHDADQTIIDPQHFVRSVSMSGFPHIDENRHNMGMIAATICSELADADGMAEWGNRMKDYHGTARVSCSCTPLSGLLFEKGPYDLVISKNRTDFIIHITAENVEETVSIAMPVSEIRRRTISYAEFISDRPPKDSSVSLRHEFEKERENQHISHASYIAEKFAQNGWYLGFRSADLLFELSSYLISPQLHNKPDFDTNLRHC